MSLPLIQVCALSYRYPDGQQALHGLDFCVDSGECVAVIGGNGAGKSTLLLHLNGVLMPSAGHVEVDGVSITQAMPRASLQAIRRRVGLVFQDPDDQLFMPTVLEDVAFGPMNMGYSATAATACALQALTTVGADHLASRPPYRLSGGQKRMVAIAGVLAMSPQVLVLDEPSAGLDPAARRRLIALLHGLGQTQIIATHDLDMVQNLCTRVLVLGQGILVADGPPGAILTDAHLLGHCGL